VAVHVIYQKTCAPDEAQYYFGPTADHHADSLAAGQNLPGGIFNKSGDAFVLRVALTANARDMS